MKVSPDSNINSITEKFSERAKHPITLDYLIDRWQKTVNEIEDGYNKSIYEYYNDLSRRDLLQEVMEVSSANEKEQLRSILEPLDEQFIAATTKAHKPLVDDVDIEKHPWWIRIPKRCGEQLKEDLQSENYIA